MPPAIRFGHLVVMPSAYALMSGADPDSALGFGVRRGDDGDVGYVDGEPGDDLMFLSAPPAEKRRFGQLGPRVVCWFGPDLKAYAVGPDATVSAQEVGVSVIPTGRIHGERSKGILDTAALAEKHVAVLGLGSGGSFIVRELAHAGVGTFLLLDNERLEVGNVTRHECGLDDVGRLKVNAMTDLVRRFNPAATVATSTTRISGTSRLEIIEWLEKEGAELIICATDGRESRLLANRMSLQTGLPLILGGVYRRAYGGLVQRVIPGLTACYQCFVHGLPVEASDTEISGARDAARYSYTDREVEPQPGLSSDIVPIALQMVKLALLELIDDRPPAFAQLAGDLVAPLYHWINRREFAHAEWDPLGISVDKQAILRWYGAWLDRRDDCAACASLPT